MDLTKENKELLLKDLCTRSPYGVKIHLETSEYGELIGTLDAVYPTDDRIIVDNLDKAIAHINVRCGGFNIEENKCKSYLRPMSSVSELISAKEWSSLGGIELIDWYNANHIDYRGLIPKGLAIEVTKENNPYRE